MLLILDEWMLLKPTDAEQKIFLNFFIEDVSHLQSFVLSIALKKWYDQLGGEASPLLMQSLIVLLAVSYRINITSIDTAHDKSMREVYGLDKTLRE